jgi:hypothetical protein
MTVVQRLMHVSRQHPLWWQKDAPPRHRTFQDVVKGEKATPGHLRPAASTATLNPLKLCRYKQAVATQRRGVLGREAVEWG